jgi:hypothetical protein
MEGLKARPKEELKARQMVRHLARPKEGPKARQMARHLARPMEAPMARPMVRHLARPKEELKARQMVRHLAHLMVTHSEFDLEQLEYDRHLRKCSMLHMQLFQSWVLNLPMILHIEMSHLAYPCLHILNQSKIL